MSSSSSISHISSGYKYHVKFDDKTIETIVTNQSDVAEAWVQEILVAQADNPQVMVGFRVESDYSIIKFRLRKCSTLNLCTETKCIILQLGLINEIPQSLKNFLMNPSFTFVGVHEDFTRLVCDYDLDCAKSEDIRSAVIKKWPRRFQRHDFEFLAKELAGLDVEKRLRDGNYQSVTASWGDRVLHETFVEYACIVAYAAYKIGNVLLLKVESTEPQVITNGK